MKNKSCPDCGYEKNWTCASKFHKEITNMKKDNANEVKARKNPFQCSNEEFHDAYKRSLENSSKAKATPRPWKVRISKKENQVRVNDSNEKILALCGIPEIEEAKANAALIVRAVNNFEGLLEACCYAMNALGECDTSEKIQRAYDKVRQAIQQAKEIEP